MFLLNEKVEAIGNSLELTESEISKRVLAEIQHRQILDHGRMFKARWASTSEAARTSAFIIFMSAPFPATSAFVLESAASGMALLGVFAAALSACSLVHFSPSKKKLAAIGHEFPEIYEQIKNAKNLSKEEKRRIRRELKELRKG